MATLLPTPEQQWIDQNGNPLESGTIYTYVPGTTTPKATYQDADQITLNTNPVILDAAGRAIIYGSGSYRFIVRDSAGNLVYDQVTADTSVGGIANGGTSTGTDNAQVIAASSFSQQDGQIVTFVAGLTNTGPMTVAPGGGSGIPVLQDTYTGPEPLSGGEVVTDNEILLIYEAALGAFHLVNPHIVTRASLGLATTDSPQFAGINLGNPSDTTLTRSSAGVMAVEGNLVPSPASQAEGDILYRGASSWSRLAKGTANQRLRMNSGATAPEWGNDLGIGQSWQNVTGSRVEGTSYQNTTGIPIQVYVSLAISTGGASEAYFQVSTDNVTWVDVVQGTDGGDKLSVGPIVPNNIYYRVPSSSNYSITYWAELR